MKDNQQGIDRQPFIDYLILFSNKTETYYEKLTDRELIEEYERFVNAI